MATAGNKKKDTNLKPQQVAMRIAATKKKMPKTSSVDPRGTKTVAPSKKVPMSKPAPKPTKSGLNVAVPGGGTYNTVTKKTTYKPKDIPMKKTKGMTPQDAAMKKILEKKYGFK